jgi:hypothetical protein
MTVSVLKQNNANAPVVTGSVVTLEPDPTSTGTLNQIVPLKDTAKIIRIQVQSNVVGGNFQAGKSMLTINADGERST